MFLFEVQLYRFFRPNKSWTGATGRFSPSEPLRTTLTKEMTLKQKERNFSIFMGYDHDGMGNHLKKINVRII